MGSRAFPNTFARRAAHSNHSHARAVSTWRYSHVMRHVFTRVMNQAVKPYIDAVLAGRTVGEYSGNTPRPQLLGLSMLDVNYVGGCYNDPKSCL